MSSSDTKELELKQTCHLAAYDLLKSTANQLENPDSELFGLLEFDEASLNIAAKACVLASAILKKATVDIQLVSNIEDTNKYENNVTDALETLAALADEFDTSGDEKLIRKASVLDEILLTVASNVEKQESFKKAFEQKITAIKNRAEQTKKLATEGKPAESEKKTPKKEARPLSTPLTTRHCPDHVGVSLARISDGKFYCPLDSKEYDFNEGFVLNNGTKVPATSVENQTQSLGEVSIPPMFSDSK